MVGYDDNGSLAVIACELQCGTAGTIECQEIGSHTYRVISMSAKYIDPRTDEETHSVASVFPVHE